MYSAVTDVSTRFADADAEGATFAAGSKAVGACRDEIGTAAGPESRQMK